jgi:phage I-like protein
MEREVRLTMAVEELPEWIRVLPRGNVELADGRPPFEVDEASLAAMVAAFETRGVDLVVDYEHQSLKGERAPAAGWIRELKAEADGLWARVEWTAQAQEYLQNREYRYFSPVLKLNPESRRPEALLQVALTNVPAMKSLAPLVARYGEASQAGVRSLEALKAELAGRLGMEGEAAEETLWLKAGETLGALAQAAGLPQDAPVAEVKAEIEALKARGSLAESLTAEVTALKEQMVEGAVRREVEAALLAGKITPAQEAWALDYGRRDLEGFRAFAAQAPKVGPWGEELGCSGENAGEVRGLTPEELAVCRAVNITPEQYRQAKTDLERTETRGGHEEWQL